MLRLFYSLLFSLLLLPAMGQAQTITWLGNTSSDWFTASNWNPAGVPTALNNVVINVRPNMPLITAGTATCRAMNWGSGAYLKMTGGRLEMNGNLTRNITNMKDSLIGGTVAFLNPYAPDQRINNPVIFHNVEINTGAVARRVVLIAPITVNGNLNLISGTFSTGLAAAANTITVNGNWVSNGATFEPKAGLVVLGGTADALLTGSSPNACTFNELVINKSSGYQAVVCNRAITCNSSLEVQAGEFVQQPVAGPDVVCKVDLRIIQGAGFYMNNTLNTSDVEVQIGRNLIDLNIALPNRNAGANTANGLNYNDRFALITFNSANASQTQAIRGFMPGEAFNPANNLVQALKLPSINVNTESTVFLENDGVIIRGPSQIIKGRLKTNGKTLIFGTERTFTHTDTFRVRNTGVLEVDAGSSLLFSSDNATGPSLVGELGGTIILRGGNASSPVRINRDAYASRYYNIQVRTGARISVRFYSFSLTGINGVQVLKGGILDAAPNNFSDGVFNETGAGLVRYLSLEHDFAGTDTIKNVIFNPTTTAALKNVHRPNTATGIVFMQNCFGARSGPENESDPADATANVQTDPDGLIRWGILGAIRTWQGTTGAGSNSNWDDPANWVGGLIPGAADEAIIPTVTGGYTYPVLNLNVTINLLRITANVPNTFNVNGRTLTINGSLLMTNANSRFTAPAGSVVNLAYELGCASTANLVMDPASRIVFTNNTTIARAYTFGNFETIGAVFVPNGGANFIANNVFITGGNLMFVNESANMIVRGSWTVTNGDFFPVGGRVSFSPNVSGTYTITSNGQTFSTARFAGAANGTYTYVLADDMSASSVFAGDATNGASVYILGQANRPITLNLNGKKLTANNIEIHGGTGGTANQAHLQVSAGSVLAIRDGYSISIPAASTIRPLISFSGTSTSRVTMTRGTATGTYAFNLSRPCNFRAQYADFEFMNGTGIDISGATIDPVQNLSYCSFNKYLGLAGDMLRVPDQAIDPIVGTTFYFNGTPVVGTHYNVRRTGQVNGLMNFLDAKGNFAGELYEADPTTTVTPGKVRWQNDFIYWGDFTTGNWNDLPSKWRYADGSIAPIPDMTYNVILDHRFCVGPYTVTLDINSASKSLTMNSGATNAITLNCGNRTLNVHGDFETTSNLDILTTTGTINAYGNWFMNKGTVTFGAGAWINFVGVSAAIANGPTNSFRNFRMNSVGNTMRLIDNMRVLGNLVIDNGTLDAGSINAEITMTNGSWNAAATGFFTPRNGAVRFRGTVGQTITSTSQHRFFNLIVDKSANHVTLKTDIYVEGGLNFTPANLARVNTDNFICKMQISASSVGVQPNGSNGYVNGKMSYLYNSSAATVTRFFTIGKFPDYLPVELSLRLTSPTITEIVAEQFNFAPVARTLPPPIPDSIVAISTAHHWKIEKIQPTGVAFAQVQLPYNSADAVALNLQDGASLRILKSDATNLNWENITPGVGGFGDNIQGFHRSTSNWTSFSDFVFAKIYEPPFPVEVIGLEATYRAEQRDVAVSWLTASETNNAGYVIKRMDAETGTFLPIASYVSDPSLRGRGTANTPMAYRYLDTNGLIPGQTYIYKLEQVNLNGSVEDAGTAQVTIPKNGFAFRQPYPNPATGGTVSFDLTFDEPMEVRLEIFDLQGRSIEVLAQGVQPAGLRTLEWSTQGVPPGVYVYRATANGEVWSGKLVVGQ